MAIKPILFNTEMVRAIREGRKTETRRLIIPHYRDEECSFQIVQRAFTGEFVRVEILDDNEFCTRYLQPKYSPGDILWVRETWCDPTPDQCGWPYLYKADMPMHWEPEDTEHGEAVVLRAEDYTWRPSIHMPKEAAREFLRITGVGAEPLQKITAAGIRAEGIIFEDGRIGENIGRTAFKWLWNSTIQKDKLPTYGWQGNPWVWVYQFERCEKPKEF